MDKIKNIADVFEEQEAMLDKLRNDKKSVLIQPDKIDFYTLN